MTIFFLFLQNESLRRLCLAAQAGETLFFMMRPLISAQDASPAALRLALRPSAGGIEVEFVKRRGPRRDERLFLPLQIAPAHVMLPSRQVAPVVHAMEPALHQ